MFSVKFNGNLSSAKNSINNVVNYISKKLVSKNIKILSNNNCFEITTGNELVSDENIVLVELTIKKNIAINLNDFNNDEELDRHLSKIYHFCEQAKNIEELKYLNTR